MTDNLIFGINPLTISKIVMQKGFRYGMHPSMLKYLSRKNPIRNCFGVYEPCLFDGYSKPYVKIHGANGDTVKIISCKSNDEAQTLRDQLNDNLNEFLSDMRNNTI